jgi:hypothetical protein
VSTACARMSRRATGRPCDEACGPEGCEHAVGGDAVAGPRRWSLLAYTAGSAAFDSGAADFEYGLERMLDGLQFRVTLPLGQD